MSHETFKQAVERLLKEKKLSKRALGKRLHEITGTGNPESWRRQIIEWTNGDPDEPREKSIKLVARGLGVARKELPPERNLSQRVAELEQGYAEFRQRLEALDGTRSKAPQAPRQAQRRRRDPSGS